MTHTTVPAQAQSLRPQSSVSAQAARRHPSAVQQN